MANILSVAQSALTAAQVGLTTTGHNIANANTPGYSRQVVIQGTATSQDSGFGFVGKGTQVTGVKRVYDDYLASRVLTSQSSSNALDSYYSQIKQINNMFADPTVGFSPAMKDFFAGVQSVAANPNSTAARQTMLSSGEALASQLQSMDGQLRGLGEGVTSQINTSIQTINSYAQQIATLNDAIEKAQAGNDGKPANDLLDQRDQVVSDLSKEIKVSVVKQNDSYSVFIGNGQPLVVSTKTFDLVPSASSTDPSRAEVGYQSNGKIITLAENAITGGKLGGLFEFRAKTLDPAQNALGRIAIGLASTFNAQHELGQDQNGALGGAFFTAGTPLSKASSANTSDAQVAASITDVNALTGSDYQLKWDGANYTVTRLSDNKSMYSAATFPATSIDGVAFSLQLQPPTNTPPSAGDLFLIRPTVNGAADFRVAITDTKEIAAAAPIRTAATGTNTGSGIVSPGSVVNAAALTGHQYAINFSVAAGVTTYDVVDNT
ncbi:MAG TPA: flagellar hook-associated protein FlgK, partial [Burkholderiaceae bacterium]|nr:flagellar hook-associated protein FlgK [Burkholderiaceae bacterium]